MAAQLSATPVLNKKLTDFLDSMKGSFSKIATGARTYTIDTPSTGFPFWGLLIIAGSTALYLRKLYGWQ